MQARLTVAPTAATAIWALGAMIWCTMHFVVPMWHTPWENLF